VAGDGGGARARAGAGARAGARASAGPMWGEGLSGEGGRGVGGEAGGEAGGLARTAAGCHALCTRKEAKGMIIPLLLALLLSISKIH